jgi:Matrixin
MPYRATPLVRHLLTLASCVLVAGLASGQALRPLDDPEHLSYFIAAGDAADGYRAGDEELARWALDAWQRAAGGRVAFAPAASEDAALVRVYWAPPGGGQYGEMVPVRVGERRGAAVFIRPDTRALGPDIARAAGDDTLFRDAIVYLTCLHELGHALGLEHTDAFADIMYFFGFGGDIREFFARYRRELGQRGDIPAHAGLSAGDLRQLADLYPRAKP